MLSRVTLKLIEWATKLMYFSRAAPLYWYNAGGVQDPKRRIALYEKKGTKSFLVMVGIHFLVLLGYESLMIWRVTTALLPNNQSSSLSNILQVLWNLLCYSMPLLILINNLKHWYDFPVFINGYIAYFEKFKEKYMPREKNERKNGCENNLKIMGILGCLIAFQNVVLIIKRPARPYFLTSLLENPVKAPLLLKGPFMLLQFWVWLSCWSHIFYYCFNLFGYGHPIVFILKELRHLHKSPITYSSARDPRHFQKIYRSLQVLQNMFNFCCRSWLFPTHKFVVGSVAIIGIYGAIKLTGPRRIIMAVAASFAMLYLSLIFWRMGKIYEKSKDTLNSWRYEGRKEFRKFLKSSPPLKVNIGMFYFVDKTTVIVVWDTVFNATTTMLLSF